MTETTFEAFNVPAMFLASQTVLNVSGLTTDIAMDTGDGVSHGVPICESYTLHHAILRWLGRDFDRVFPEESHQARVLLRYHRRERECVVRDVEENPCYIGSDHDTDLKSTAEIDKEETCKPPDGNIITVDAESFRCVDVLFQPSFIGKEASGSTTLPHEV